MRALLISSAILLFSISSSAIDTLRLTIDSLAMQELIQMRNEALKNGIILNRQKRKVKAVFAADSMELMARIRIKGDWPDHIDTDKWSLRIELEDGNYHGMQRFSIQHPRTRGYLTEFEIHQLLEHHNVLATNYDFAFLIINGVNKGIYAVEEHFDFPMLDRLQLREAPILKFNESVFWEFQKLHLVRSEKINYEYPVFENASISAFRKKKVRQSSMLSDQYVFGRDLIHALRDDNYDDLSELIDIESFTTLYAVCDAVGLHHGLIWHNLRFYPDPLSQKLKPIAFDLWESRSSLNRPLMGVQLKRTDTIYFADVFFRDKFLNHDGFRSAYFEKLRELSRTIEVNLQELRSSTTYLEFEKALQMEFKTIELGGIEPNNSLKSNLDSVEAAFYPFQYYPYRKWKKNNPEKVKVYGYPLPEQPITGLGLKAFREGLIDGNQRISIINKHKDDLELVGFWHGKPELTKPIPIKPIVDNPSNLITLEIDTGVTKIGFRVPSDSLVHWRKISRYPYYQNPVGQQVGHEQRSNFTNDEIHLSGKLNVSEVIHVQKNQSLHIKPGTELTFGSKGGIKCLGNFYSLGTEKDPIIFKSDSTFLGIVLGGSETKISSTHFRSLSLSENQFLTGAVTVLDSKLVMKDCQFANMVSEDAFNGVRVLAELNKIEFLNCSSDALDLDFSKFSIAGLRVMNAGNDGLDLSGSVGDLVNADFQNCDDKGISCGEKSQIRVHTCSIAHSETGVAVKDGSLVELKSLSISDCAVGVWAFRKKGHYDGGTVRLKQIQYENVNTLTQQDQLSIIEE